MAIVSEQAELGAEGGHQGELAQHMLAHLLCTQRRTVTGLLNTLGRQQQDWSKAYRLYREHVDGAAVFSPILDGVLELLPEGSALVIGVDDSHFRKTGKKVAAAGWYRDPLGPAFHTNLMWSQRFIQLSAAVPDPANPKRSRMIPIAMEMIPKLPKPAKDASQEELDHYEKIKALNSPGAHAIRLLQRVREHLDASGTHAKRIIWVCGDGDYSNSTLLPHLPSRTIYIGRTRTDIHLRSIPKQPQRRSAGRPCSYGKQLPTPEALRKDKTTAWEQIAICNGPKDTHIRYKRIPQAKWHIAGEKAVVQVVVIAPLRYKKRRRGPWLYTKPAYLVCTDADMPVEQLIQAYFWRWGIEVNFKEEKQLFGAGQAQVRSAASVSTAPAVCIATYAALLLAGIRAYGFHSRPPSVSPPKWYTRKNNSRVTSSDLIKQFHHELILSAAGNFSPLALNSLQDMSPDKSHMKAAV
ncbi:MAG: transposase [Alphaproteobacteria bacterium]|nr:transposase [Alphaproteobacteria bacterium]